MSGRELMVKAAKAIRQLETEKKALEQKLAEQEKVASQINALGRQVEAAKVVLQLVADGDADPEDALEKFAEVSEMSASEIELVLGKREQEKLGHVKVASADADFNPLVSYLLGQ